MDGSAWRFLLDENVSRRVQRELEERGYDVEHVVTALDPGADDLVDVLPYARRYDRVVVTKDYSDFGGIESSDHRGLVLIANHAHAPHVIVDAIENVVAAYSSRTAVRSQMEVLDAWITADKSPQRRIWGMSLHARPSNSGP